MIKVIRWILFLPATIIIHFLILWFYLIIVVLIEEFPFIVNLFTYVDYNMPEFLATYRRVFFDSIFITFLSTYFPMKVGDKIAPSNSIIPSIITFSYFVMFSAIAVYQVVFNFSGYVYSYPNPIQYLSALVCVLSAFAYLYLNHIEKKHYSSDPVRITNYK